MTIFVKQLNPIVTLFCIIFSLGISPAYSSDEELQKASAQVCEKMKSCALAQLQGQNLPPGMQEMITQTIDGMCAQVQQRYQLDLAQHSYYKPTLACLNSISQLSCNDIQNIDKALTTECATLQEMASRN